MYFGENSRLLYGRNQEEQRNKPIERGACENV